MARVAMALSVVVILFVATQTLADAIYIENIEVSSTYPGGHSSKWNLINDTLGGKADADTVWDTFGHFNHPDTWDKEPWVAFYFDGAYRVNDMMIWNYWRSGETQRGVCDVIVLVSSDTGDDWASYTFTALPGVYRFDPATTDPPAMQTIGLGGVETTAVKFQILSNWAGIWGNAWGFFGPNATPEPTPWGHNSVVGLSKVAFDGTAIPEPATMTLLALGGLALLRRGRR